MGLSRSGKLGKSFPKSYPLYEGRRKMIEIKAIIQPFKLRNVVEALREIPNFPGLTVTKVQGFGREKGKGERGDSQDRGRLDRLCSQSED
jgi:hypothetical protein